MPRPVTPAEPRRVNPVRDRVLKIRVSDRDLEVLDRQCRATGTDRSERLRELIRYNAV